MTKETDKVSMAAVYEEQRIGVQFGAQPDGLPVEWLFSTMTVTDLEATQPPVSESNIHAMYARLASAYEATPPVPDHGGGVPGDRFPV